MVRRITVEEFKKYTDFIETHPCGHFMQSPRWAEFKKNQKSFVLIAEDEGGKICASMLLFLHNIRRTKGKILYCPRGPVCSRDDTKTLSELLEAAHILAKEIGAYKLTLDPDITEEEVAWIECFKSHKARIGNNKGDNAILQPFAVYRINVDKNDDELMASYHSKARYSVRSSVKSGAVCRVGTRDDIPCFCNLLADTAKRDGFTARGEDYFYEMYDALGEDSVKLFIVEYNGMAIAGSVLIKCASKTWHMYAGSSDEYKETLPNFLMQWEMMRWSRDNGCPLYDMRGIAGEGDKLTPIEGLVRFKKRFGGELVSFVGRIDIVYDIFSDIYINSLKGAAALVRKILGRNKRK